MNTRVIHVHSGTELKQIIIYDGGNMLFDILIYRDDKEDVVKMDIDVRKEGGVIDIVTTYGEDKED